MKSTPDASIGGPSITGVLIHRLIAELAQRHGLLTPERTVREARRALSRWEEGHAPVYRQAIRMRVITAAGVYFAEFSRPGWRLVDSLVIAGDSELDLIWERRGRFEADELKTGRFSDREHLAARVQAERQATAGRGLLGMAFAGVRVVPLTATKCSFWVGS